jgi:cell division protein FtsB
MGDAKMNLEQDQQKNLIDTTDCLEAIEVFRCWKNFLFVILILCLLLLQASFWLVNTGCVATEQAGGDKASVAAASNAEQAAEAAKAKKEDIKKAAEQVAASDKPAEAAPSQPQYKFAKLHLNVEFKHLAWLISFVNFVLVPAAILYCLTILFSLKVSLVGRLGGINHICRAFFLSLVFLVLLLPWQILWRRFFAGEIFGAMYTAGELQASFTALKDSGILYKTFYYLRFSGYWLIALLPLIFSYIRSCRWSKATLRRLEVI